MESSTAQFLLRQFACVQLPKNWCQLRAQWHLVPVACTMALKQGLLLVPRNAGVMLLSWGELRPSVTQVGAGW